jgi:hypothetical protein
VKAVHALGPAATVIDMKVKDNPVTDRGDPQGFETSRLPHFLENRLKDGVEIVSLRAGRPLPPPPEEDSWYSFMLKGEPTPGLDGLGQLKIPMISSGIEPVSFRLVV